MARKQQSLHSLRFGMKYVCLCVCVHSGRGQGRCFEQRAAEHQATSGGDGGGEETAGGGDGPGNSCL